jgi:predicted nucleic acid-binding Zn ribbon protein
MPYRPCAVCGCPVMVTHVLPPDVRCGEHARASGKRRRRERVETEGE